MDQAIRRGDIYWHALPFNGQAEFFDAPLFEYSAFFVHRIDDQFNLTHKRVASLVNSHCDHAQVSQPGMAMCIACNTVTNPFRVHTPADESGSAASGLFCVQCRGMCRAPHGRPSPF